MTSKLADRRLFFKFLAFSMVGMVADFLLAVSLATFLGFSYLLASTIGFLVGSMVNYCGHTIFSYNHVEKDPISLIGYGKYLLAVLASLIVRLVAVGLMENFTTFAFWFILLCAIAASFFTSYAISTLWVFRKTS